LSHNKDCHRIIIGVTCLRFSSDFEDQSELEYDAVSIGKYLTIEAENFSEKPARRRILQDVSLRQ